MITHIKQYKYLYIFFILLTITILFIIHSTNNKTTCSPPCKQPQVCNKQNVCIDPPKTTCSPPCKQPQVCNENNICTDPPDIPINDQIRESMQIINNTTENFLHVFLQSNPKYTPSFNLIGGNSKIGNPINWTGGKEWYPLGNKIAYEVIIPKNGNAILSIPDTGGIAFIVMAIKMKNDDDTFLVLEDGNSRCDDTICKVSKQSTILIEAGRDMVSDVSAVDGINFRIKYEITTDTGVKEIEINQNPCKSLDEQYQLDVGCKNPAKIDCTGEFKDSCNCKESSQECMYTDCSVKLFNVEKNNQYYKTYDDGKTVKKFINNSKNLRNDSPLKQFCTALQDNSKDFTAYCYDYNDVSSSEYLRDPYKIKITYTDL